MADYVNCAYCKIKTFGLYEWRRNIFCSRNCRNQFKISVFKALLNTVKPEQLNQLIEKQRGEND